MKPWGPEDERCATHAFVQLAAYNPLQNPPDLHANDHLDQNNMSLWFDFVWFSVNIYFKVSLTLVGECVDRPGGI